jgi:hypothetical protein
MDILSQPAVGKAPADRPVPAVGRAPDSAVADALRVIRRARRPVILAMAGRRHFYAAVVDLMKAPITAPLSAGRNRSAFRLRQTVRLRLWVNARPTR